jgi:hypothetical protein
MAEAKAVGLKEQSPLGLILARRALPFERDGFSLAPLVESKRAIMFNLLANRTKK